MKITNPKPESTRHLQAPTRDEVIIGMPTIVGASVIHAGKTYESPLAAVPPVTGSLDTPISIQARQEDR